MKDELRGQIWGQKDELRGQIWGQIVLSTRIFYSCIAYGRHHIYTLYVQYAAFKHCNNSLGDAYFYWLKIALTVGKEERLL